VDYAKLTPVLVEAIKEQNKRIVKLEKLEKEMETIKYMLQAQNGK
jgi:hypothetical protein